MGARSSLTGQRRFRLADQLILTALDPLDGAVRGAQFRDMRSPVVIVIACILQAAALLLVALPSTPIVTPQTPSSGAGSLGGPGAELLLYVDAEAYVSRRVAQHAELFDDDAVEQPSYDRLLIHSEGSPSELASVLNSHVGHYDHVGSDGHTHAFVLDAASREAFERRAVVRTVQRMQERLDRWCLGGSVRHEGGDKVRVYLPHSDRQADRCP